MSCLCVTFRDLYVFTAIYYYCCCCCCYYYYYYYLRKLLLVSGDYIAIHYEKITESSKTRCGIGLLCITERHIQCFHDNGSNDSIFCYNKTVLIIWLYACFDVLYCSLSAGWLSCLHALACLFACLSVSLYCPICLSSAYMDRVA